MTDNINKADRQLAAYLARKYFSGQISKYNLVDSFPNADSDPKILELLQKIEKQPKKGWLVGVSKTAYEKYLEETYKIIDELEG